MKNSIPLESLLAKELEATVPTNETQDINCLVCRHCQMAPHSDFSTLTPAIFCAKRGELGPMIASGCSLADPRFEYEGKRRVGGDQQRDYHDVADAYLKANYARLSMARLAAVLRRSPTSIYKRAHRLGLTNGARASVMFARNGHKRRGQHLAWTADQLAFLRAEYTSQTWPTGTRGTPEEMASQDAHRARIIAEVAVRGSAKSWTAIRHKCLTLFTPRGQERQREKTLRDARKQAQKRVVKRNERAKTHSA